MKDYISQCGNGKVVFDCERLPDKAFIDAVKVKDICMASIAGRNSGLEREPGSPDVILKMASGGRKLVSRKDLVKNYSYGDGGRITCAYLKNDKGYLVYSKCNIAFKVMQIPDNSMGKLRDKKIPPKHYIIMQADEQGNAVRETMHAISSSMFHKMFRIPMQDVILRNLGKAGSKITINVKDKVKELDIPMNRIANNNTKNTMGNAKPKDLSKVANNISSSRSKGVQSNPAKANDSKYRFTVINQVMDMNNNRIGFTIKEIATGKFKQVTTSELALICSKKVVDNVELATNKTSGVKFLRGNGIVLTNLPSVLA